MTAKLTPTLRTLGCCARITCVAVVWPASLSFAQQSVVTLGIPSAKSLHVESTAASTPPIAPPLAAPLAQPIASDTVWPPIRVNTYVPADTTQSDSVLIGAPGMFVWAFAESTPSPIADLAPIAVLPASNPIPAPRRMSVTPAGPQLSPTKWVHQPLVARQVDQPDSVDAVVTRSTVRDDAQPSPQPEFVAEQDDAIAQSSRHGPQDRPLTEIRRAAMRQRATRTVETYTIPIQSEPIQPGYSIDALRKTAMELIAEGQLKLDIRAYMSAEEKAKKALELIAQSIDTREQSALAARDLMISLTAIREAEDFVGRYGMVDGETITRMVRSHSTEILKPYDTSNLNGLAAADVYLDWSRRCITPLAGADPLAAEAIRILAQSHRLRDDGTPFGVATSVHLLRAAAEGSPDNQQVRAEYETALQVAGLTGDAAISQVQNTVPSGNVGAMVSHVATGLHSHQDRSIAPASAIEGQQKRDVKIVEVTPEQFAAISPATAGPPGTPNAQSMPVSQQYPVQSSHQSHQRSGTYRPDHVNQAAPRQATAYQSSQYQSDPSQEPDNSVKARLSRAFHPITRHLR